MKLENKKDYAVLRWRKWIPRFYKSELAIVWKNRKSEIVKTDSTLLIAINLIVFTIVFFRIK